MQADPIKPRVFVERAHRSGNRTYFTLSIPNDLADCVAKPDSEPVEWATHLTAILEAHREDIPF